MIFMNTGGGLAGGHDHPGYTAYTALLSCIMSFESDMSCSHNQANSILNLEAV